MLKTDTFTVLLSQGPQKTAVSIRKVTRVLSYPVWRMRWHEKSGQ